VAGGKDESVSQPLWTPKNELLFISDRTGWWNIYREVNGKVIYLLLLLLLLLLLWVLLLLLPCLLLLLLPLKHPGTGHSLCQQALHCCQLLLNGMALGQPSKWAGSCANDM